jgi:predicted AAA+ superfamily ATPase
LLTLNIHRRHEINYWYRNQPGSTAEVDFVLTLDGQVVALEVKAGKTGKLKSLHLFMAATQHAKALRIYHGPLRKETVLTSHKKKVEYYSLPFYLLYRVREFVN